MAAAERAALHMEQSLAVTPAPPPSSNVRITRFCPCYSTVGSFQGIGTESARVICIHLRPHICKQSCFTMMLVESL